MNYINIYDSLETDFSHQETVIFDYLECVIEEEINGIFTLDLTVSSGSKNSDKLVMGNIIKAHIPGDRPKQLFRIVNTSKDIDNIKVFAQHIGIADLGENFIRDTNIVGKDSKQALQQLLDNTMQKTNFVSSGPGGGKQENLRIVRYSPLQAMLSKDDDNTMINRFGCEFEFNNFNIGTYEKRGSDNGVTIRYAKNLTSIIEDISDENLITRVIPQGAEELLLPEYYIDSPKIGYYHKVYHSHQVFDDIKVDDETTTDQAYQKLRDRVSIMFNVQKVDTLFFNYKVNFIELRKTEEYKDFKVLESVSIGDTVYIKVPFMKVDLSGRVISYKYDLATDTYNSLVIGFKKEDITDTINTTNKTVKFQEQIIDLKVSSLDDKLSSELKLTQDEIDLKVSKGDDFSSEFKENAEGFEFDIGNSKDTVFINKDGITVKHQDGSYSKMNSSGIMRYVAGTGQTYHYVMVRGSISNVKSNTTARVQLPDEFKGKDYQFAWWSGNVFPENQKDLVFSANTELVSQDKKNANFDLKASLLVRNPESEGAPNWRGSMNLMYIAIL